jgi:hypothetical protein
MMLVDASAIVVNRSASSGWDATGTAVSVRLNQGSPR